MVIISTKDIDLCNIA